MTTRLHAWVCMGALLGQGLVGSCFAVCETCPPDPPEGPKYDSAHYLTGDWFGLRNKLYDEGVSFDIAYATEPAGNPTGGLEQGVTYLHNFHLGLTLDLQKIFAVPDTTFLVTFSQRSGRGLTQDK